MYLNLQRNWTNMPGSKCSLSTLSNQHAKKAFFFSPILKTNKIPQQLDPPFLSAITAFLSFPLQLNCWKLFFFPSPLSVSNSSPSFLWKYFSQVFATNLLKSPLSSSPITFLLLNSISDLLLSDLLLAAFDTTVFLLFPWKTSPLDFT